jgi:membrane protease YdiL (CAAX protease family)
MFIAQAFKSKNEYWKYSVGFIIVILSMFVGQIPLGIAFAIKKMTTGKPMPANESQMYTYLENMNLTLFLILLSFAVMLLALVIVVKTLHKQRFKEVVTARQKVDWKRIWFSFIIWAIFSAGSVFLIYYLEPGTYILQFNLQQFIILVIIAAVMIPLQTTAEELLFRGYLMQGIGLAAKNRWVPLLATSVIFGAMHLLNPEVGKMGYIVSLYYVGTGLFLGILTLMDEGTELALGFHAANNLTAALLVTADWTAFQTHSVFKDISEPSAGFDILFPLLVIYPILLLIFSKKYGWTSWKEKLTGKVITPDQYKTQTPENYEP